jgi:CheY-like chemotaxis protein
MTEKRPDRENGADPAVARTGGEAAPQIDHSLVLVVGRSRINRVVVSRIVERSGLRPVSEGPDTAAKTLKSVFPRAVILDGGPDNQDCECLMSRLVVMRGMTGDRLPAVILLSTHKIGDEAQLGLLAIDAVVSKPILPELLQPVVDRLIHRDVS